MSQSPTIKIYLLGSVHLERGKETLEFARQKTLLLLAYLALHPQEHPRERIASIFWKDATTDEAARLSLRVTINDLRKTLGEDSLIGGRDSLQLNPDLNLWIDVREFQRLTDSRATPEDWQSALSLYTGDLLPQVYEDWVLEWRAEFEQACLETRLRLAQHQRGQGQYVAAIETARLALEIEPVRESTHQLIILCYESLGDREAALLQYESCSKALREIGVEPSPELQGIYRRLQKTPASLHITGNLPRPLTSFIGREEELNEVETLLAETRFLTLLGAGGSGKTRLAIQAADESAHNYPDGVWWVDLAPLLKGDQLPQAIAKSLGVKEKLGADMLDHIASFIGERKMLIILDNCEHLVSATAHSIEAVSAKCQAVTFLATSREPLGVASEIGWQTPAFPLPEPGASHLKTLAKNESVRLFVERGRAVNGSFQLNGQNVMRVAEICRRLEGMPLAIELAAAQVNNLTLDGILSRLEKSLNLTSTDAAHARHAALHSAIEWSYNLLTPAEQMLFRRLAIFSGGWNLASAAIVAAGYSDPEAPLSNEASEGTIAPLPINGETVTRQILDALVKKALAQFRRAEGSLRYDTLDTLREFAREKMNEVGETQIMQERHALTFFNFLKKAWDDVYSERESSIFNQIDLEYANLRTAWAWQLQSPKWVVDAKAINSQNRFWYVRGHYAEGRETLEALLKHPDVHLNTLIHATLLNNLGLIEWKSGNRIAAKRIFEEALVEFRTLQLDFAAAMIIANLAGLYIDDDDMEKGLPLAHEAVVVARETGNQSALNISLNNLAIALTITRDFKGAREAFYEGLALSKEQGDIRGEGIIYNGLADIEAEEGNFAEARRLFTQSFMTRSSLGDRRGSIIPALNLIRLMCMDEDWENAACLLGFVEETLQQLGIQLASDARAGREEANRSVRLALDEETVTRALQFGKTLTLDSANRWLAEKSL